MATSAHHLIQDQNISIHFDGGALMGKNDTSKAQKKGGLGGRKVLNDISNSAKPSALQASKRNYSSNVTSIGKDLDATRNKFSVGTKDKGGRKALTDLTNSSKSSAQQVSKKGVEKKLSTAAAANTPTSIAEEQFLHDHQKCIKAQKRVMDLNCFLKEVGLNNDIPVQLVASPPRAPKLSMKSMADTPMKHFEVEEMPELLLYDTPMKHFEVEEMPELLMYDQVELPSVGSPRSPKMSFMSGNDVNFTLIRSPDLPKH